MISILAQRALKYTFTAGLRMLKPFSSNFSFLQANHYYFAYGANLSIDRLRQKHMIVEALGPAKIPDYKINFDMPTEFKEKGYASIEKAQGFEVWGVAFKISKLSLILLDIMEWVPFSFYDRISLPIELDGKKLTVFTYMATHPKKGLTPSNAYLGFILDSSRKLNFPASYIEQIQKVKGRDHFEIDHGFRLSNPGKPRLFLSTLYPLYRMHDQVREWLANKLP